MSVISSITFIKTLPDCSLRLFPTEYTTSLFDMINAHPQQVVALIEAIKQTNSKEKYIVKIVTVRNYSTTWALGIPLKC